MIRLPNPNRIVVPHPSYQLLTPFSSGSFWFRQYIFVAIDLTVLAGNSSLGMTARKEEAGNELMNSS